MMKKHTAAILLSTITCTAMAGELGTYGEILLGNADTEASDSGISIDDNDDSFGLRFGYKPVENIAAELSYQYYGKPTQDTAEIETTAINVGLKGMLPLNTVVSLHLRAGLSFWDSEISSASSIDDNGVDLYWGFGADFNITKKFKIGIEYTLLSFDFQPSGFQPAEVDIENLSLSFGLNF